MTDTQKPARRTRAAGKSEGFSDVELDAIKQRIAGPPCDAAQEKQKGADAERQQQARGQRAPGVAPMEGQHGDAKADGAAQIDDGIGDHGRRHDSPGLAGVRGRKMPNARLSSNQ